MILYSTICILSNRVLLAMDYLSTSLEFIMKDNTQWSGKVWLIKKISQNIHYSLKQNILRKCSYHKFFLHVHVLCLCSYLRAIHKQQNTEYSDTINQHNYIHVHSSA